MNDPLDQLRQRFTGLRPISGTGHGQVYAGQDRAGADVTVAVLSDAAAADPAVRDAFADAVWRHSPGAVPEQSAVYAADLHAGRPWAAIRNPAGQPGAEQLLAGLRGGGAAAPGSPVMPPPPTTLATPPGMPPPTTLATPPGAPPPTTLAASSPSTPPPPTLIPSMSPPGYLASAPASPAYAPGSPAYAPGSPAGYQAPSSGYPSGYGAQQPPPPGGGYPTTPSRSGSPWPWLIGVGAAVVALVVLIGVVVVVVRALGEEEEPPPITLPEPPPPAPPPPTEGPGPTEPPESTEEPQLRDLEPISLIGPTFADGDDTYTMAFAGWPFAFRTPGTWGCLAGSFDPIPEALVWSCQDESDLENGQRVLVMLWECPTSCTEDEQDEMIRSWLDQPEQAVRQDEPPVAYVEYEENVNGNYAVDLSSFAGAGGDLRWHVGVYAESPPDIRDDVLRILNDILTQSA